MIIELDMSSSTPIYVQLRNQIVKGIGKGELKTGEKLESELELLSAEACLTGMSREEFLSMCDKMYSQMKPCTA